MIRILIATAIAGGAWADFSPLFHEPNEYSADGQSCASLRPDVKMDCPPFCVALETFKDPDVDCRNISRSLGCHVEGFVIFPDGQCRDPLKACPDDIPAQRVNGFYVCPGFEQMYPNICGCSSTVWNTNFHPCATQTVIMRHYYRPADLDPFQENTMAQCAESAGLKATTTIADYGSSTFTEYPFPLLYKQQESIDGRAGYLQCPQDPEDADVANLSLFDHWFWIVVVSLAGADVFLLLVYSIWRTCRKASVHKRQTPVSLLEEDDNYSDTTDTTTKRLTKLRSKGSFKYEYVVDEDQHIHQIGYHKSKFTSCARVLYWGLIVGMHVLLLFLIFDTYGLLGYMFCPSDTAERCEAAQTPQDRYYWREGLVCAAHCIVPPGHTKGSDPDWPYHSSGPRSYLLVFLVCWAITLVCSILTKVYFHKIQRYLYIPDDLSSANVVLIEKPRPQDIVVEEDTEGLIGKFSQLLTKVKLVFTGKPLLREFVPVNNDASGHYFIYQCTRFVYSATHRKFMRLSVFNEKIPSSVLQEHSARTGLSTEGAHTIRSLCGANEIPVPNTSYFMSFKEEFSSVFYLYQLFCLWVWFSFFYWVAALVVFSSIFASGLWKVRMQRLSQKRIASLANKTQTVAVRRDNTAITITSNQLVPGDIVYYYGIEGNVGVPADMLILRGKTTVDESNLTGESEPAPKTEFQFPVQGDFTLDCTKEKKSLLFAGSTIMSNAREASTAPQLECLVLFTGSQTLRGKLIRSILEPATFVFKFDQHWRIVSLILLVWGIINLILGLVFINWELEGWYYGIFTVSQCMSPLIPAAFVACQSKTTHRLRKHHQVHCIQPERSIVAGKVKIICFDKTGTLTVNGLRPSCIYAPLLDTTGLIRIVPEPVDPHNELNTPSALLRIAMGTCHELELMAQSNGPVSGLQVAGNDVDKSLFRVSGFVFTGGATLTLAHFRTQRMFTILHRFGFQRDTMSSSAVVYDVSTGRVFIFTKGSAESIASMCRPETLPRDFSGEVHSIASTGAYVIAWGYRELVYSGPPINYNEVDRTAFVNRDLIFLGLTCFTNQLKASSVQVIQQLKAGGVASVIVTGDHSANALYVARSLKMVDAPRVLVCMEENSMTFWKDADTGQLLGTSVAGFLPDILAGHVQLAVDGSALPRLVAGGLDGGSSELDSVLLYVKVFSRMSPEQKVQVVELFMRHGVTAMIGDGANDAGALQRAHLGVSVSSGASLKLLNEVRSLEELELLNVDADVPHTDMNKEAAIVAQMSTNKSSLLVIVECLKEGRCAMANAVASYKNLVIYGEIMIILSAIEMYFSAVPAEMYFITVDVFVNIGMSLATLLAKPAKKLSFFRPTSALLGTETFFSCILQTCSNLVTQVMVFVLLFRQSWFRCKEFDARIVNHAKWWEKGDNYEAATLGLIAMFQFMSTAPVLNFGFDYRRSWFRNYYVPVLWVIFIMLILGVLLTDSNVWSCLYHTNCGDYSLLAFWYQNLIWDNIISVMPYSTGDLIPPGCSCDSELYPSPTCEAEYRSCDALQFHQTYHHNIFPMNWRYTMMGIVAINIAVNFVLEGVFVVGPIRRHVRKRKSQKALAVEVLRQNQAESHYQGVVSTTQPPPMNPIGL